MNRFIYILVTVALSFAALQAYAQTDKKDVRRGNRDFRKEEYREAEIDYRKALVKDSLSVAANYNLANTLYRQGDYAQAMQTLSKNKEAAALDPSSADYFFNLGDAAIQQKDWQTAVDAFAQSLIRNPDDMDAKENFIYAKKMLQNQQNQQNQNQQNQNQQNQDQQSQDDKNQNQQNQDNQDQQNQDNQDQNQDDKDQNQDDQKEQPQQGQQPKITPQAAQQMLQAIQAKEKETQDKVNKQKAEALKSRQKEKNW